MNLFRVHRGALSLMGVLVTSLVAALAAAASSQAEGEHGAAPAQSSCGSLGVPPCPLQGWMRANIAGPLASNNMTVLAIGFDKAASLSPDPAWSSWSKIAATGADSARKGDLAGVRAACKTCHNAWREAYRARFRTRPLPR